MEYEFIKHISGTSLKTFVVSINWRELHFHNDMEIFLVLKGSVNIDDGQQRHLLKRNDIFISNRNAIHSLRRTQEENLLMVLQLDPLLCKKYYPRIAHVRFTKRHILPGELAGILGDVSELYGKDRCVLLQKGRGVCAGTGIDPKSYAVPYAGAR